MRSVSRFTTADCKSARGHLALCPSEVKQERESASERERERMRTEPLRWSRTTEVPTTSRDVSGCSDNFGGLMGGTCCVADSSSALGEPACTSRSRLPWLSLHPHMSRHYPCSKPQKAESCCLQRRLCDRLQDDARLIYADRGPSFYCREKPVL